MKLIILRTNLLEALGSVERAIGENVNLPILKNFLMRASGGGVEFISTNLEIAVERKTAGKVIEEGEATIPFSIFNSIIRNLGTERITIEREKDKIMVSSDNYESVIQDEDPKEFPIIPRIADVSRFLKVKAERLRDILRNISLSVQYSAIRPEISGVYLSQLNGVLSFVGTDGFRLSEIMVGENDFSSTMEDFSLIIPLRTVQEAVRMFNGVEDLSVFTDSNQILFESENEKIISRIIDGSFPDYKSVIPKDFKTTVSLDKNEFLNSLKLVSAFSGKANDVSLKTGENGKFLEISASDATLGKNVYKIPAKVKGDDFAVVFNWRYLLDGLKMYRGDEIDFRVSLDKPAAITSPREPQMVYIVMPIKG
jgi:DNA polymerase-3 subunit beta